MEQLAAVTGQINVFLLVLTRVLGIIMTAPVISSRYVPAQVKIGLSAIVSLSVFSVLKTSAIQTPDDLISYVLLLAGEVMVGLAIGFSANLIFAAIQLAGEAIDMQLGFSIVSVFDPMQGTPIPQMGNFKYLVALLVYLVTNTHHFMFAAILKSYDYIPLLTFSYRPAITKVVMDIFGGTLDVAVKIALPAVGVLIITDVALGILARTVPQMNIFVVGMPLKIYVGMIVIMLALPLFGMMLNVMFENSFTDLLQLMKAMGG